MKTPIRILFLTQYYPPEKGAPQNRISEFAQQLRQRGFEVSILTAMPNYPTGRILPGYRGKLFLKEMRDDITVYRSFIVPLKRNTTVYRLLNYFSFVVSSILYGLFIPRFDLIISESPPLTIAFSLWILKTLRRARYVFNVSDLWPDSIVELGAMSEGKVISFFRWVERKSYQWSSAVTGQAPSIVRNLRLRTPAEIPVELISNGADLPRFGRHLRSTAIRKHYHLDEHHLGIVYAGLHGMAQGLEQILDVADRLADDQRFRFILLGDGPEKEKLMTRAKAQNLKNLIFCDPVDREELPAILASMDLAMITLGIELTGAVPSKIYEAMASELPVVFVAGGDGVDIINDAEAGVCCSIGDIQGVTDAILRIADDPELILELGKNGRQAVESTYSRQASAKKLGELLEGIVMREGGDTP
jgi:glycosyltransferase involved in cell wall biosynthesis